MQSMEEVGAGASDGSFLFREFSRPNEAASAFLELPHMTGGSQWTDVAVSLKSLSAAADLRR